MPSDGDCAATGGVLDVNECGTTHTCDPTEPQSCQIGDLSGKHGQIMPNVYGGYGAEYIDDFIATFSGVRIYIGDKSVLVLDNNGTTLGCANITEVGPNVYFSPLPTGPETGNGTTGGNSTTSPIPVMPTPTQAQSAGQRSYKVAGALSGLLMLLLATAL